MKMIILIGTLLCFSLTFAKDWTQVSCPEDLKILASELIEVQLSGAMVSKKSKCLVPSNFKYVEATHSAPSDGEFKSEAEIIINKNSKLTVISVASLGLGEYKVLFSISSGKKIYKDELQFLHYPRYENQVSDNECAGVTVTPSKIYMRKNCI